MTPETLQVIEIFLAPVIIIFTTVFLYLHSRWAKKDTDDRLDKADETSKTAHAAIGTRIDGVDKRVGSVESTVITVAGDVKFLAGRMQGRQDEKGK